MCYSVLREIPSLAQTSSGGGYKRNKAQLGRSRVREWKWMPFTNAARDVRVTARATVSEIVLVRLTVGWRCLVSLEKKSRWRQTVSICQFEQGWRHTVLLCAYTTLMLWLDCGGSNLYYRWVQGTSLYGLLVKFSFEKRWSLVHWKDLMKKKCFEYGFLLWTSVGKFVQNIRYKKFCNFVL